MEDPNATISNIPRTQGSGNPRVSVSQPEPIMSFMSPAPTPYGLSMPYPAMGQNVLPQVSSLMQPFFMQTSLAANKPNDEVNTNPVIDTNSMNRSPLLPGMALMPAMLSPVNYSHTPTFYCDNRQLDNTQTHVPGPENTWVESSLNYPQINTLINVTPQISVSQLTKISESQTPPIVSIPSVSYSHSENVIPSELTPVLQHPKRRLLEKIEAAVAFLEGHETQKLPDEANTGSGHIPAIQESDRTMDVPLQNDGVEKLRNVTNQGKMEGQIVSKEIYENEPRDAYNVCVEIVPEVNESVNSDLSESAEQEEDADTAVNMVKAEVDVIQEDSEEEINIKSANNEDIAEPIASKRSRKRRYTKPTKPKPSQTASKKKSSHFRRFQNHWVKNHPWIFYDGEKMFCQVCIRHKPESKSVFTSGTCQFKSEAFKIHEATKDHKMAWKLHSEKRKCNCLTSNLDSEFDDKQRYMLQNILQHFRWLDYNKRLGILTCDLCKRHSDENFELKLDSNFHIKDIIIHRDTGEHLEAEETEMNAWETMYDTGMAEIDASLLQLLACRESIYTSTKMCVKQNKDKSTKQQDEEEDDWMPGSSRRKNKKPRKYIQAPEEMKRKTVTQIPEPVKLSNPTDLMGALIKLVSGDDQVECSKVTVSGEDNNNTLNMTQKYCKPQSFRIHGVNPWIVQSELVAAAKMNSKNKETTAVRRRRRKKMDTETKEKVVIPGKKINVPKFKYRLLPTIGKFNKLWLKEFPWLDYHEDTNVMLCKPCVKHRKKNTFYRGCRMFQRPVLVSHQKLKMHQIAADYEKIRARETASKSVASSVEATNVTKSCGVQEAAGLHENLIETQQTSTELVDLKISSQNESEDCVIDVNNQSKKPSAEPGHNESFNTKQEVTAKPYNPENVDHMAITQLLAHTGLWTSTPLADIRNTNNKNTVEPPSHGVYSSDVATDIASEAIFAVAEKCNDIQSNLPSTQVLKSNFYAPASVQHDISADTTVISNNLISSTSNIKIIENIDAVQSSKSVNEVVSDTVADVFTDKQSVLTLDSAEDRSSVDNVVDPNLESSVTKATTGGYKEKRKPRTFQPHWKKDHPWLVYDEEKQAMYCRVCIRYDLESTFTTGNSTFKLSTVKSHQGSIHHQKAIQMEFLQGIAE